MEREGGRERGLTEIRRERERDRKINWNESAEFGLEWLLTVSVTSLSF